MKLGFIGLGIMGTPMAINLARAGHQLHVTTIGPVADELLSLGAVSVETARQCNGSIGHHFYYGAGHTSG